MSQRFVGAVPLVLALAWLGGCGSNQPAAVAPASPPESASESRPESPEPSLVAPPDLARVAAAFLRFARGRVDHPLADTPVTLYLGGHEVTTITETSDRGAWRVCPDGGSYAGATCPFSALDVLARFRGEIAATTRQPEHPCAHPARLPDRGRSVTLTPLEPQSCTSYFGVQLHVNDVGQVTDVDLVMAEP